MSSLQFRGLGKGHHQFQVLNSHYLQLAPLLFRELHKIVWFLHKNGHYRSGQLWLLFCLLKSGLNYL